MRTRIDWRVVISLNRVNSKKMHLICRRVWFTQNLLKENRNSIIHANNYRRSNHQNTNKNNRIMMSIPIKNMMMTMMIKKNNMKILRISRILRIHQQDMDKIKNARTFNRKHRAIIPFHKMMKITYLQPPQEQQQNHKINMTYITHLQHRVEILDTNYHNNNNNKTFQL